MTGRARDLAGGVLAAALLCTAGALAADARPIEIGGPARAVDGDTLVIGAQAVRLEGIDAPEDGQDCEDARGRSWHCGAAAGNALTALVRDGVRCTGHAFDAYERLLGTCRANGADVGAVLVRDGLALAYVKYTDRYAGEEAAARKAQRGVWQGDFTAPWDWRRDRWRAAGGEAPSPDCPIKGNVNGKGERIYHPPWSRGYARTRIDEAKGERWFCDEAEALAAGWRAPRR